jgi:hypothetical protein
VEKGFCNDIENDPIMLIWKEEALKGLPIFNNSNFKKIIR